MVSVWSLCRDWVEGLEGTGSNWPWKDSASPGSSSESAYTGLPVAPLELSLSSGTPSGRAARTPRVLSRHCAWLLRTYPEPFWAALGPQPRISSDGAVTTGRVIGG